MGIGAVVVAGDPPPAAATGAGDDDDERKQIRLTESSRGWLVIRNLAVILGRYAPGRRRKNVLYM